MRVILFSTCFNLHVDLKTGAKNREKVICLFDNCIKIGCGKFPLLRRKYLSLTANVSTNSSRISDIITKKDYFPDKY